MFYTYLDECRWNALKASFSIAAVVSYRLITFITTCFSFNELYLVFGMNVAYCNFSCTLIQNNNICFYTLGKICVHLMCNWKCWQLQSFNPFMKIDFMQFLSQWSSWQKSYICSNSYECMKHLWMYKNESLDHISTYENHLPF